MADSSISTDAETKAAVESGSENEVKAGSQPRNTSESSKEQNKSKKTKVAEASGLNTAEGSSKSDKTSDRNVQTILDANPALKGELSNMRPDQAKELLRKMNIEQLLTGMSISGNNQKDMASHKFWQTQPVPRLDESKEDRAKFPDGPIKEVTIDQVSKQSAPLPEGYEWVELDLLEETELKEVYGLLNMHYVEDDKAMFRFDYSKTFLDWALKAPDWRKCWHVGVRAQGKSRLLVASIFGIPTKLRVRDKVIDVVEINYLCIHKKLRSKRLAPVLIKEITRRCNLEGIFQAIYTGGTLLPTPVSTCRYYHRPLQWTKLYEVGFSSLPPKMTPSMMVKRNRVPDAPRIEGWREMEEKDIDGVLELLTKYLKRFDLVQEFTREEVSHWFINRHQKPEERVVWAYVVEGPGGSISDFSSFYNLESTVISDGSVVKHSKIRAAYLFYYASTAAFEADGKALKERLKGLVEGCLVEAKRAGFDVFNALTLLDNPLLLEDLKFGPGDGQLHYYLYNWRTSPIKGGVNKHNLPDIKEMGGMGMVML